MKLKTYGVNNLVEWNAQLKVGAANVTVHFQGGAITKFGITPAEYSTTNPMYQHIIENSNYFKEGHIFLIREAEVEDDAAAIARKKREAKRAEVAKAAKEAAEAKAAEKAEKKAASKPAKADDAAEADNNPEPEQAEATNENEAEGVNLLEDEPQEEGNQDDVTTSDGTITINATCKEDVVSYLKENYKYTSIQLRSNKQISEALKEHGIVVEGFTL